MSEELVVGMSGELAGVLTRVKGDVRLEYDDTYIRSNGATPLSVALPLTSRTHPSTRVVRWLSGLLPDDTDVLRRWSREFEVPAHPFDLLRTPVGEDCAGAVQFAPPDRVEAVLKRPGRVRWLSDEQIAERLRELRKDRTAWLGVNFTGQFSLAGAQAKTALHKRRKRWGDPSGATPTTHILKPAIVGLDDHDLNEHLCLRAAARLGLIVARTSVERFGNESGLVVERYDRAVVQRALVRVHQEDICQALGRQPSEKYQFEGGPTPAEIVGLFRSLMSASAADDASWRFLDALAWNWIIAGTDAHGRNYSLLLSGEEIRLAPLYDIASAIPYPGVDHLKLKLAMKLGGEYRLKAHRPATWPKMAAELGLDEDAVVTRVRELAERSVDALVEVAHDAAVEELGSPLPARLIEAVAERQKVCLKQLP
jgi:serine/threonine-protein kinase HipA